MGDTYLPSNLTSTGSFTVTNTGTIAGTATVTIAAPEAWASGLPIRVWPNARRLHCCGQHSGHRAQRITWAAPCGNQRHPQRRSQHLFLRAHDHFGLEDDHVDERHPAGEPRDQRVAQCEWMGCYREHGNARAADRWHVQPDADFSTPHYRAGSANSGANANNNNCADVSGSGGRRRCSFVQLPPQLQSALGVSAGSRRCAKPRDDQAAARNRPATHYNGTNARIMNTPSGPAQLWYVQQTDTGRFQLVSVAAGLCLSMSSSSRPIATMVACNSASAQLVFDREPLVYDGISVSSCLTSSFVRWVKPAPQARLSAVPMRPAAPRGHRKPRSRLVTRP